MRRDIGRTIGESSYTDCGQSLFDGHVDCAMPGSRIWTSGSEHWAATGSRAPHPGLTKVEKVPMSAHGAKPPSRRACGCTAMPDDLVSTLPADARRPGSGAIPGAAPMKRARRLCRARRRCIGCRQPACS
jgi:hypothetical protein